MPASANCASWLEALRRPGGAATTGRPQISTARVCALRPTTLGIDMVKRARCTASATWMRQSPATGSPSPCRRFPLRSPCGYDATLPRPRPKSRPRPRGALRLCQKPVCNPRLRQTPCRPRRWRRLSRCRHQRRRPRPRARRRMHVPRAHFASRQPSRRGLRPRCGRHSPVGRWRRQVAWCSGWPFETAASLRLPWLPDSPARR